MTKKLGGGGNDMLTMLQAAQQLNRGLDVLYRQVRSSRIPGAVKDANGRWQIPQAYVIAKLKQREGRE